MAIIAILAIGLGLLYWAVVRGGMGRFAGPTPGPTLARAAALTPGPPPEATMTPPRSTPTPEETDMASKKTPARAASETPAKSRTPTPSHTPTGTRKPSPSATKQATQTATPTDLQSRILQAVNRYRATQRRSDLAWDDRLAAFAQGRAQDMMTRDYFSHNDPQTGKRFLDQLGSKQANGETLYQLTGSITASLPELDDLVLAQWKESPPHAAIMGDQRMTRGGVGVATTANKVIVVLIVEQ